MKHRILIVDDELAFLSMMKLWLKETGRYEVRTVNLASQALYVAHEFKPDLILLDCMMPNIDGGELAGHLQADPELRQTPFLFLTCTVTRVETAPSKCYAGPQTFVPKSIEIADLTALIEQKLAERAPTGQSAAG